MPYEPMTGDLVLPVRRVLASLQTAAHVKSFVTFLSFYCTLLVLTALRIDFVRAGSLSLCPHEATLQHGAPSVPARPLSHIFDVAS